MRLSSLVLHFHTQPRRTVLQLHYYYYSLKHWSAPPPRSPISWWRNDTSGYTISMSETIHEIIRYSAVSGCLFTVFLFQGYCGMLDLTFICLLFFFLLKTNSITAG